MIAFFGNEKKFRNLINLFAYTSHMFKHEKERFNNFPWKLTFYSYEDDLSKFYELRT